MGEGGATLRIKYSKTQQAAQGGFLVPLAPSAELPCPVAEAVALLTQARRVGWGPRVPLFSGRVAGGRAPPLFDTAAGQGFPEDLLGGA